MDERLTRMLQRGRALKALYLRFPCRLTARLLVRQVARIEAALPKPPSHVAETFGRLRFRPEHPVAQIHEARVRREIEAVEQERIRQIVLEKLTVLSNLTGRSGSASDR